MIRVRETGELIDIDILRQRNPNVSIPNTLKHDELEAFGIDLVAQGKMPIAGKFEDVAFDGVENLDGVWTTKYSIVPFSDEKKAEQTASRWDMIRCQRDGMLAASDWTQLPDAPIDRQAWAVYRQALRDITNADDPFDITWPAKPEA